MLWLTSDFPSLLTSSQKDLGSISFSLSTFKWPSHLHIRLDGEREMWKKRKKKTIGKGDIQLESKEERGDTMKILSYSGVLTQKSPH